MNDIDQLASPMIFAKIGWCDEYSGHECPLVRPSSTNFVAIHGDGWERYNFKKLPDGLCFGYMIPNSGRYLPAIEPRSGWTVIFVAPLRGKGPLTPVGFYLNTTIESEYLRRPEYDGDGTFPLDATGWEYGYCLSTKASDAYLIRAAKRDVSYPTVPGKHFGQTTYRYAERDGDAASREYYRIGREVLETGLKLEWPIG